MAKKTNVVRASGNKGKDDKTKPDGIIKSAVDCLKDYQEREDDNIKRAEEAIRFRAGEQWPDAIKRDRENPHQDGGSRPCPVFDKVDQYVRQIVNEERQTRAAIRVRPVDDKADPKVAEIYNGIIRHIEDASNALDAYATAGEHAIDGGFGYWRVLTEYCDPMSFEQDIRVKRIPNRFSVALGPHSEPDGSDAKEALIWEDVPEDSFKAQYPNARLDGFEADDTWRTDDMVRVAEYMRVIETKTRIYLMPNGEVWTGQELQESGLDDSSAVDSRETVVKRIRWYKLTGVEVLDERDMLGSWLPVVKVIGNELVMPDGEVRLSGMIEKAMDPQRMHNYALAGFIENVALAPRAPWVGAKEAIRGYEDSYADANRQNIAVLPYNHLDEAGNPIPPPQRTSPAGISTGWAQTIQFSEHGVESSLGMYGPSVGARSQEKSGIALQEQKQQGMVGNFHFPDNLARSIQHTGRILIEWIPKVYDTERIARMLGEDGKEIMAYLDPEQQQPVAPRFDNMRQEIGKSYNLNVGKYDVTVTTGPSYTSKRQESVDNQLALVQARPDMLNMIGDQLYANMDFPGADKIAKRFRTMLPPQVQQAEAEGTEDETERKANEVRQMAAALEEKAHALFQKEQQLTAMMQAIDQAGQAGAKERADLEKLRAEIKDMKASLDIDSVNLNAARKVFNAELRAANAENVEPESGREPERPPSQPVQVFDSSMGGVFGTLAESMALLAQSIAQGNAVAAQNSAAIAAMAESISRPKRGRFDEATGEVVIMPAELN